MRKYLSKRTLVILGLSALFLGGCASKPNTYMNAVTSSWLGGQLKDLILVWGPPDSAVTSGNVQIVSWTDKIIDVTRSGDPFYRGPYPYNNARYNGRHNNGHFRYRHGYYPSYRPSTRETVRERVCQRSVQATKSGEILKAYWNGSYCPRAPLGNGTHWLNPSKADYYLNLINR